MDDKLNLDEQRTKLLLALRAGNIVQRFHTERTLLPDTVGHHTANLMGVLLAMHYPDFPPPEVMTYAVMHDMGEQFTGDIPAQAKWDTPELKAAADLLEQRWLEELGLEMPVLSDEQKAAVKFADSFDALMKTMDELALGNNCLLHVTKRLVPYCLGLANQVPETQRAYCQGLVAAVVRRAQATTGDTNVSK